jgi:hypothetical protein
VKNRPGFIIKDKHLTDNQISRDDNVTFTPESKN